MQESGTMEDLNGISLFSGGDLGVAVGDGGTLLHTTTGGEVWAPRASNTTYDLHAVAFGSASVGIAAGDGLTIARTTDGGLSWIVEITDFLASLYGAQMLDAQRGFVAGVNSIFEPLVGWTLDGGAQWEFQNFRFDGSEGTLRDVHFLSDQLGYVVGNVFDGQGAIARTTDGGAVWETIHYASAPLLGLDFADASVGIAVGAGGLVLRTTNGGASWAPETSGTGVILFGVSAPAAAVATAVGEAGTILRTTGASWSPQASGTLAQLNEVFFAGAERGWVAGDGGTILHTTTGGEPPTAISDPGRSAQIALLPGRPNPFRQVHEIAFELPVAAAVRVELYDANGRRVRRLAEGARLPGRHAVAWDGRGDGGRRLPAGLYVYRLEATAGATVARQTGKVVLLD